MLDARDCDPTEFIAELEKSGEKAPRKKFANLIQFGDPKFKNLELIDNLKSNNDNFQKLIFKTEDDLLLETVIIPLHKLGKVSVCLSSQVGCVMGCDFCATAKMRLRRNLKTWEIVDQFLQARAIVQQQGRAVSGCVFMGMGEPFLNYESVIKAAKIFSFPILNAIAKESITISTVGVVPGIERFTKEGHRYRLSVSIGAAIEEKRKILVPVASHYTLPQIVSALKNYSITERINIAYVCISGVNTSEEDAQALGNIFKDLKIRLDLIDVNDLSGKYQPPSTSELASFRDALNIYLKQPVVRRYSGGSDIRAACGTLNGEL